MEAGKRSINDIFNGARKLEIPFFQRSYVWRDEQWERLLQDMEFISDTNLPYFFGSIILKQQKTGSHKEGGDTRTLVDGQQRLTTLNIFCKVLCLKTDEVSHFDHVFKLHNKEIALLHNHNDIDSFNKILDLDTDSAIDGKGGIPSAHNYFRENIDPEKLDFNRILSNVMFVGIDLGENEDEQQIFDTINSLGVRLTTAELLKNYFFGREDLESYEKNWKEVFEKDDDTKEFWDKEITAGRMKRNNIDLFFYSYLQIKLQDPDLMVKAEDKKNFGKVIGLFDSYKRFISDYKLSKSDLIAEIREYAKLYIEKIDYDVIDRELTNQFGIERINAIIFGLENTTLLPYILYILHEVKGEEIEQRKIFEYLESYIMKRMVCHTTNKNYNRLFSEQLISNKCITKKLLKEFIEDQADRTNYMPDEKELQEGFHESKLINKQSAGILYLIESRIRNRADQATALLGLKRYSLEHLMPKKWENHWNGITSEEDRLFRNRKLLTLGNLTIITASLNRSIRDSDWQTKKTGKDNKKGLLEYSSGIETINEYLNLEDWNESVIEKRAEYLYEQAREIWK